jgi:hypothetical protein
MKSKKQKVGVERRSFLSTMGVSAGIAASLPAISIFSGVANAFADDIGPQGGRARAESAEQLRLRVAERDGDRVPIPNHPDNNDEERYPTKFASYSKCLKHDACGEVDPAAYAAFLGAIRTGRFSDFEALATSGHLGSADASLQRRLVNPVSGYAYDVEGVDSHQFRLPPAPAFASAEQAGEAVELYWMALTRDIAFADYGSNPAIAAAVADISKLSDFRGPKDGGKITPGTLFRDAYPGCLDGPYISQFLLQPCSFGAMRVDTRVPEMFPMDFMTDFTSWLNVQNGVDSAPTPTTANLRYVLNARDLSHYVNIDQLFEAYFVACLNLLAFGYLANSGNPYGRVLDGGAGRHRNQALDPNGSLAQTGFGTFGGPSAITLVSEPATRALKNEWYQKWLVHRKLRPEEFGGRVEVQRLGTKSYPFHADLENSSVLAAVMSKYNTVLLPMAYAEGSPNHPSYASGHGTVAGAAVTMLKWLFDETQPIKNPVVPNPADGGQTLIPYVGPTLTVGGELNKIVSNVSQGRNIAGVHWRSDALYANLLGEETAITILRDIRHTVAEPFDGATITRFDGSTVKV